MAPLLVYVIGMGLLDGFFGKKSDPVSTPSAASVRSSNPPVGANATMEISQTYNFSKIGPVAGGKILSGMVKIKDVAMINGKKATVNSIQANHQTATFAQVGDLVAIGFSGIDRADLVVGQQISFSSEK